ncbi:MAG: ABC transporter ATP-binding protein [Actinomycetota bacterium]|nr:ABC transporter ATP-binding protein [Actinomycetota bacterium]
MGTGGATTTEIPAVRATGLSKRFRRKGQVIRALEDIDLEIEAGEFVSLIGPSGCGKSTLLRIVGGLLDPDGGTIAVGGAEPIHARRAKLFGFVPQVPALMPWRTVRKNVAVLTEVNKGGAGHQPLDPDATLELLDKVGLTDFLDAYPHELSGGMQQRVSLVRTFVLDAPVMLMDEPFSALDEITRAEMAYLLLDLWGTTGNTVVFVTHSIPEAVLLSDRVVSLRARPGRIAATEQIELPRPRTPGVEDTDEFHAHVASIRAALREGWER